MKSLGVIGGLLFIPVIIIVILVIAAISTYNGLVKKRELVKNAMAQIAAQLESRWDAIKTLIDATKDYKNYESETLQTITANRANITRNSNVADVQKDDEAFSRALTSLIAVAESYPDLKASTVYTNTMDKIDIYENKVRHSRMIYNDTVTRLNQAILSFPSSIFASMFGFTQEEYFKTSEGKENAPSWNG